MSDIKSMMAKRFRGYCPIIIDVETGGLTPQTDALLEIAAVSLKWENGRLEPSHTFHKHVRPFAGANLDKESLKFNKIVPDHPFRFAADESEVIKDLFVFARNAQKTLGCMRCVLVGHNSWFDLHFMNAAIKRTEHKRNPFHAFTSFDTATLSAVFYGQTVLAKALAKAKIPFNPKEAHSAMYDAQKTAELFCSMVNQWKLPEGDDSLDDLMQEHEDE